MAEISEKVVDLIPPASPLSILSREYFKGRTYTRQTAATVGLTVATIVRGNPNRVGLMLVNNSASIIYIGFDVDTTTTHGIPIAGNGGNLTMNVRSDGEAVGAEIVGLSSVAARPVTIIETLVSGE